MEIRIVIDDRVAARLKSLFRLRNVMVLAAIVATAAAVGSAEPPDLQEFKAGDTIFAKGLNDNFNALKAQNDLLTAELAALKTKLHCAYPPSGGQQLESNKWGAITWGKALYADVPGQVESDTFTPKLPGIYRIDVVVFSEDWFGGQPSLRLTGAEHTPLFQVGALAGKGQAHGSWIVRANGLDDAYVVEAIVNGSSDKVVIASNIALTQLTATWLAP